MPGMRPGPPVPRVSALGRQLRGVPGAAGPGARRRPAALPDHLPRRPYRRAADAVGGACLQAVAVDTRRHLAAADAGAFADADPTAEGHRRRPDAQARDDETGRRCLAAPGRPNRPLAPTRPPSPRCRPGWRASPWTARP